MEQQINIAFASLVCKQNNKATLLCCCQTCPKSALICRSQQCKCLPDNHRDCQFVYTENIVEKVKNKKSALTPQLNKAIQKINKVYEEAIEQLSQDRQNLEIWKKNYGLSQDQAKFIQLINTNSVEEITGQFVSRIKKNINFNPNTDWLSQNWVQDFWKKQKKNFDKIFNQIKKLYSIFKTGNSRFTPIQSEIIQDGSKITKFFNQPIRNLKLIYRASANEFKTNVFHDMCDGVKDTIILVRTQQQKIIGAYTHIPWQKVDTRKIHADEQKKTFLFSVSNDQKYELVNTSKAVQHYSNVGPRLGGDDTNYGDFQIANEANANTSSSFNFPLSFNNGAYTAGDAATLAFIGKQGRNTKIKQWQVFSIEWS